MSYALNIGRPKKFKGLINTGFAKEIMKSSSASLENPKQDSTVKNNFENQSLTSHSRIENALQKIRKTWVDSRDVQAVIF